MNQIYLIILVIIVFALLCQIDSKEHYYYKNPPLSYSNAACARRCDNTAGCNSHYYDDSSRQCFMNSMYTNTDLFYPYNNNTQYWMPSKFRFGKYFGVDPKGNYRPSIAKYPRPVIG
jgi:hypothetical protein